MQHTVANQTTVMQVADDLGIAPSNVEIGEAALLALSQ
jgi:hypothetical protein